MPEQLHQTSDILTTTKKNEKKMKKTGRKREENVSYTSTFKLTS